MKLAATVCLIPELAGGPFLFSGNLADACRQAAAAGFDAVELLVSTPDAVRPQALRDTLLANNLTLSGVSTGGAFLVHQLHLCRPEGRQRGRAIAFSKEILDLAAPLGGFAVVGVVKGVIEPGVQPSTALGWLREGLEELGDYAAALGTRVMLEPLNRYESTWLNRLDEGVELLQSLHTGGVQLLADLFHMNIEEQGVCGALRNAAEYIGHVHLADSNRRALGFGHTDAAEVGRTLREIGYQGYLTAEILPRPDSRTAAGQAVSAYRKWIQPGQ